MADEESSQGNSSDKIDDTHSVPESLKPLDGGYGWLIVIGSFAINFICKLWYRLTSIKFPQVNNMTRDYLKM